MAAQVFKNAYFFVNGVDLSNNIDSLTLSYDAASLDVTNMGLNSKRMMGGLKNHTIAVTFFQNFACVDATLFGLVGCQTSIEMRACNACSSAGNPQFFATYLLKTYPPMTGAVGVALKTAVSFDPASDLTHCAAVS